MTEEGGESDKECEERVYERERGKKREGERACGTPQGEHSSRVKNALTRMYITRAGLDLLRGPLRRFHDPRLLILQLAHHRSPATCRARSGTSAEVVGTVLGAETYDSRQCLHRQQHIW